MAKSKCPKCESTEFEIVRGTLQNSKVGAQFIQCCECGSVVGTFPSFNAESAHNSLIGRIDQIGKMLSCTAKQLLQIQNDLVFLKNKR